MTLVGWAQIALVLALVLGCAVPLSKFVADVYAGERNFLSPVIGPVERGFYRLAGVDPAREQDWFVYTLAMLAFSVAGFLVLYGVQRLQGLLPLNPRGFDAVLTRKESAVACHGIAQEPLIRTHLVGRLVTGEQLDTFSHQEFPRLLDLGTQRDQHLWVEAEAIIVG